MRKRQTRKARMVVQLNNGLWIHSDYFETKLLSQHELDSGYEETWNCGVSYIKILVHCVTRFIPHHAVSQFYVEFLNGADTPEE